MQPIEPTTLPAEDAVFQNEDEQRQYLTKFCYGDLFIIGKIWIQALKTALVGATLSLVPVVHAAKPPEPPQKPPPMKYKELPLYKSPHYEYKDYLADKDKCPEYNVKLIHKALLPHVKEYRKKTQEELNNACCCVRSTCREICETISTNKKNFKCYMRCPDNLCLRQGVVASGTLAGFLLGGGGGIPRRFFFTSLGGLTTGALCFPKETDEYFREACYHTAKVFIGIYNSTCGKNFALRERLPCKDDLPPPPKQRKPLCLPKK
jgi:MICOS complex subunit MIC27